MDLGAIAAPGAAKGVVRRLLRIRGAGAGLVELQTVTKSYGEQAAR